MAPGRVTERHSHNFHEIFWVERGEGVHRINGWETVLRPGRMVLIRADDEHGFSGGDHCLRMCNVAFSKAHWETLRKRYWTVADDPLRDRPIRFREFHTGPAEISQLAQIAAQFGTGDRGVETLDRFILNATFIASRSPIADEAQRPGWLALACRDIASREWFSRGTAGFVELAARSPAHVSRAARRFLGLTPTEIVNEARLAWAAARLAESDEPIVEIAYDCGLENLSHFYRLFRRRYGTTPQSHRRKQHQVILAD
jgi:AraC family cel operon transcriptional repressor